MQGISACMCSQQVIYIISSCLNELWIGLGSLDGLEGEGLSALSVDFSLDIRRLSSTTVL
jgi:hypothetical protein